MCMQIVEFRNEEAVQEWIKDAAKVARRAYEAQQDWNNTQQAIAELVYSTFPEIFKDDGDNFIGWIECYTPREGAVSREVNLFRVCARLHQYNGDEEVKRYKFTIPCGKCVLTDEEHKKQFLAKFRDEMIKGGF